MWCPLCGSPAEIQIERERGGRLFVSAPGGVLSQDMQMIIPHRVRYVFGERVVSKDFVKPAGDFELFIWRFLRCSLLGGFCKVGRLLGVYRLG